MILPELISREFLGSYTRQGDERWNILVRWTHMAMLEAEVLGITQANVDEIKKTATNLCFADGNPHGGLLAAFIVQSESRKVADVLKRTVVLVPVKIFRHRIIGDRQIHPPIVATKTGYAKNGIGRDVGRI